MIASLHFIRPLWLLAIIPLLAYCIWYLLLQGHKKQSHFIDKHLAPYILSHDIQNDNHKLTRTVLIMLCTLVAITALSGPSWEKLPQPVTQQSDAMVILLDLSASMNSQDIAPSRLIRAKQKITDLLTQRKGKQTAFIAYAADAYIVTPITDDTKTIATHIPNLTSESVRLQGSRIDRAISQAQSLLTRTKLQQGHVVAITDGLELNGNTQQAIANLRKAGHRFSILAVSTAAGGPIPKIGSGFITDNNNNIVLSKLDALTLHKAAALGNGVYTEMTIGESDIQTLLSHNSSHSSTENKQDKFTDQWKDMGAYLSILLIPFLLLCFRRGVFFTVPLCFLFISQPSEAIEWRDLFLNQEQRAYNQFKNKQYNKALENFSVPEWQASSEYRLKNYDRILEKWDTQTSDGLYNLGNTQVHTGDLPGALQSYRKSLQLNPDNEDAQYNYDLVKQALEQQKQDKQQNQPGEESATQPDSSEPSLSEQSSPEKQNEQASEQQQTDQQQTNQQESNDASQSESAANVDNNTDSSGQSEPQDSSQAEEKAQQAFAESLKKQAEDRQKEPDNDETNTNQPEQLSLQAKEQMILEQQWLDRIQDDPGGLLRRKFEYQDYINKQQQESQPW